MPTSQLTSHTRHPWRGPNNRQPSLALRTLLGLLLLGAVGALATKVGGPRATRAAEAATLPSSESCVGPTRASLSFSRGRIQIGTMRESETVAATPSRASAPGGGYSWPLKPFDRQHPVRAFLNDPRIGRVEHLFHFGIDIAAPDATPVYSVEAGTVYFDSPRAVAVLALGAGHSFGYWHVIPAVRPHQFVHAHQLIGYVQPGWGHVHFAERRGGSYLNPLRSGALTPYADHRPPTISEISLTPAGSGSTGKVDVVVDAFDMPQPRVPGIWKDEPVTPALIRWRLVGETAVGTWHTAVDFRWSMLPAGRFTSVYAPPTRQNTAGKPGLYCFHLTQALNLGALRPGSHTLQVTATDTRGNRALAALPVQIGTAG